MYEAMLRPENEIDPNAALKAQKNAELIAMAKANREKVKEETKQPEEEQSPDAQYLHDLVDQMKLKQPSIYRTAVELMAVDMLNDDDQPMSPEEIDLLIQEKLQHQSTIPADTLQELAGTAREEEITADSKVWDNISTESQVGDVAKYWQEFYRKTLNEIVRS